MDLPPNLDSHTDIFGREAPVASSSASPLSASRRRRTASVVAECCRTCRLRKVKCGGNPGHGPCINCSRLELTCSFTALAATSVTLFDKVSRTTPSHSHTEAGTLRKRAQRACSQCHSHKTKCSGDLPRCKRCDAAGLPCEYLPAKRKFANVTINNEHQGFQAPPTPDINSPPRRSSLPSSRAISVKCEATVSPTMARNIITSRPEPRAPSRPSPDTPTGNFPLLLDTSVLTAEELLSRKDLLLRHMDAYFENLYWIPSLGIFHPDTTYQRIQDGTFHPTHAAAVCGIASLFVNPGEAGREFGRKCSDMVEFHLFRNCYKFDEDTLYLFALNGAYNFLNGSFAKVWQCSGMAVRLMLGLQVNWEGGLTRNRSFVEQEAIRRVAWQIYNMDRQLAGGYDEYLSCRSDIMKIRLPCNDRAFRENTPIMVEKLHDKPFKCRNSLGLHGHQLRLVDVRHCIQATTKKLISLSAATRSKLEPSKVMADIINLQNDLTLISTALPDDLKLSDQSISRYVAAQERPGFVFLHTHIFASHIDLYRFALPSMNDKASIDLSRKLPTEFLVKAQKQAVANAISLARFCDAVLQVFDTLPKTGRLQLAADAGIGPIVTQSLRVLLIALQHNLYQDLAEHTTPPQWRSEPADEAHIRGLINSLLSITEPWCQILPTAAQAHKANLAMVAEFNRTRKFADQKRSSGFLGTAGAGGATRLPGPHYILENAHAGVMEEERRSKAGEAAAVDRWFGTPQSPSAKQPAPYQVSELEYDGDDGPPGLPIFLARSQGAVTSGNALSHMYDGVQGDAAMMDMPSKPWQIPELNALLAANPHLMGGNDMPLMNMEGANQTMFQQPPMTQQPSMPPPQFIQQQQQAGVFLGYPQQYTPGPQESPYMQQASYG